MLRVQNFKGSSLQRLTDRGILTKVQFCTRGVAPMCTILTKQHMINQYRYPLLPAPSSFALEAQYTTGFKNLKLFQLNATQGWDPYAVKLESNVGIPDCTCADRVTAILNALEGMAVIFRTSLSCITCISWWTGIQWNVYVDGDIERRVRVMTRN